MACPLISFEKIPIHGSRIFRVWDLRDTQDSRASRLSLGAGIEQQANFI